MKTPLNVPKRKFFFIFLLPFCNLNRDIPYTHNWLRTLSEQWVCELTNILKPINSTYQRMRLNNPLRVIFLLLLNHKQQPLIHF